jgi:hypothetical protein
VNPSNSGKQTEKEKAEFAKLHEQLNQLKTIPEAVAAPAVP